jgi:hypothetical protein
MREELTGNLKKCTAASSASCSVFSVTWKVSTKAIGAMCRLTENCVPLNGTGSKMADGFSLFQESVVTIRRECSGQASALSQAWQIKQEAGYTPPKGSRGKMDCLNGAKYTQ